MSEEPTIFIVDDDQSVGRALRRLFISAGYRVEVFSSADEFLTNCRCKEPACMVLDVQMPGLNGLELQERMTAAEMDVAIVFITGHGDIPMSVRAMKAGAIDFLSKPFDDKDLLDAVREANSRAIREREARLESEDIFGRFETLTPREREVFLMVVTGMLNKQVGYDLNISEKTVKVHRARVMEKMKVRSLADLVRLAERLNIKEERQDLRFVSQSDN
jgi:RNA polymerase sigma factor (sigma-70 family)